MLRGTSQPHAVLALDLEFYTKIYRIKLYVKILDIKIVWRIFSA